jgi:hypothetical protein
MRTIVAGCRYGVDYADVVDAIEKCGWTPSVIISGGASGADAHGEHYAVSHGIPFEVYLANWKKYGLAAGPIRNTEMANVADALIAIWDNVSGGTANMISSAKKHGLKIHVKCITR